MGSRAGKSEYREVWLLEVHVICCDVKGARNKWWWGLSYKRGVQKVRGYKTDV